MTRRETDTSASEAASDRTKRADETERRDGTGRASGERADETDREHEANRAATTAEREALFDALVAADVLAIGGDGERVRTTDAFDDTHAVYHDSYVGVDGAEFHEAVAATFGLPDADAAARVVAERGVSREEFVVYLAVRSHVEGDAASDGAASDGDPSVEVPNAADLAEMAGMVHEVVPDSPVPAAVPDVTDDPETFLAESERAVVSVWKRFCDPCEATKADLPTVIDAVPDDAAVAGVDGERAVAFCETHGVESAPGFVAADGPDRGTVCESDADAAAERLRAVFTD